MNENKYGSASYHPRVLSPKYGQTGYVKPLTANRSLSFAVKDPYYVIDARGGMGALIDRRRFRKAFIRITVTSSTKIICLQRKYQKSLQTQIFSPPIDTCRPSGVLSSISLSVKSQFRCQNPLSGSSLAYSYSFQSWNWKRCNVQTLGIRNQPRNWINWMILLRFTVS